MLDGGNFGGIIVYITRRMNQNGPPILETYDMEHFQPNQFCARFIKFVPLCFKNNVKLLNFPSNSMAGYPEFCFGLGVTSKGVAYKFTLVCCYERRV